MVSESCHFGQGGHICVKMSSRHIGPCIYGYIVQYRVRVYSVETGVLFRGVKRPEREVNSSPPSSAVVENLWTNNSTIPIFVHDVNMAKHTCALYCVHIYMHL